MWTTGRSAAAELVAFNRDIRPILSDKCFFCHGPDKNQRKADLRLDVRQNAVEAEAFVPGQPDKSALVERIFSTDPDETMPPADSHKKLSAQEKELLKRWIAEGAQYEGHWSYVPPKKPEVPTGATAIDALIGRRLQQIGWQPAAEADRRTLIRRLSFDLLGLPPTPGEVDEFLSDSAPDAYERVVDRMLASSHFGERLAISWLDAVRFADTIGYHSDNPRNVWPYRDYVIRSFNANKPFDRFTLEQLAGDLLPDGGQEQKVASAFNRLLLSTEEGGAQAKDYEARMLGDRVRSVGTVWLGQTIGCCQCHDHKFDPLTSRDFYSLGAFFADIQEPIIGRREEGMHVPDQQQAAELARLNKDVADIQQALTADRPELASAQAVWETAVLAEAAHEPAWIVLKPDKVTADKGSQFKTNPDHSVTLVRSPASAAGTFKIEVKVRLSQITGLRLEALSQADMPLGGPGRSASGNFILNEIRATADGQPVKFARATASFEQSGQPAAAAIDGDAKKTAGWGVLGMSGADQVLTVEVASPPASPTQAQTPAAQESPSLVPVVTPEAPATNPADKPAEPKEISLVIELIQQAGGDQLLGHFRLSATSQPRPVQLAAVPLPPANVLAAIQQSADKRTAAEQKIVKDHYRARAAELVPQRLALAKARDALAAFEKALPKCLVSTAAAPRIVRILPRGNWQDESGPMVEPAWPAFLASPTAPVAASSKADSSPATAAAESKPARLTRLDLARWVVSRDNPLTARVYVNRLWKQFFGAGLCNTLDDLGSQGEWPQNPELLDWLACEFMDSGWNVKHMVREIVTSHAYRQVSTATKEQLARDPDNRLLARQSRFRLDAELVRDNALAVSGLLVRKIGGPSAKPYQPDGYWENLNFPTRKYETDSGENQYRRGLYTWWQRSFLHPSMLAFDAPTREECAADRTRSNIPQQALVLLNDPTYVEAARALAGRIVAEGGANPDARIHWAWRQVLQRAPRPEEAATIRALVEKQAAAYRADKTAAESLLHIGSLPLPADVDPIDLAAWTNVARVLLNLHETITRN